MKINCDDAEDAVRDAVAPFAGLEPEDAQEQCDKSQKCHGAVGAAVAAVEDQNWRYGEQAGEQGGAALAEDFSREHGADDDAEESAEDGGQPQREFGPTNGDT